MAAEKEVIVANGYEASLELIKQAKEGTMELSPGLDLDGTLEATVSGVLSKLRDKCAEICMTELSRHNAPLTMAVCGSKGANLSISFP